MSHPYQPLPPLTFPPPPRHPRHTRRCLPGVSGTGEAVWTPATSFVKRRRGVGDPHLAKARPRHPQLPGPATPEGRGRLLGPGRGRARRTAGLPGYDRRRGRGGIGGGKQAALPTATAPSPPPAAQCRDSSRDTPPEACQGGGAALR